MGQTRVARASLLARAKHNGEMARTLLGAAVAALAASSWGQTVVAKDTWQGGSWALDQPGATVFAAQDLSSYGLAVLVFTAPQAGVLDRLSMSLLVPVGFDWNGAVFDFIAGRGATQLFVHPLSYHARWTDLAPVNPDHTTIVQMTGGAQRHNVVFDLRAKNFAVGAGETLGIGFGIRHSFQSGTRRLSFADPALVPAGTPIDAFVRRTVNDHTVGFNDNWNFPSDHWAFRATIYTGGGASIAGKVEFGDYVGTPPASVLLEFKDGSGQVVATRQATLDSGGRFLVSAPPAGSYFLSLKHRHWLRRTTGPWATPAMGDWGTLALVNGDLDEDDEIAIGDYAILSSHFGTGGPGGDVNGDGDVDIGDFAILSANFGQVGD